ncbi:MAG TPA: Ig-like domain-containing protein, partial [Vulgatibacter sp.]
MLRGASPAAIIVLAVGLVAGCAEPLEAVPQGGGPIADRVVGGGEPITDSESVKAPVQAAVRPVYEASPFGPDIERLPNQIDLGGKEPNDDEEPGSPDPGEHPGNQPKLSVKVEPESFTLAASESLPLQARLTDSLGRLIQSRDAIWWSEDARIATVGPDGIVTARSPGFVTISVSVGGIQGNARLTVTRTAIGRVDIRGPGASEIVVGSSVQLSTVVRDSNGLPLLDRGAPSWSVDRPDIATIDHAGRLTARAPGPVRVSAVIDGVLGTRNLTAVLRFVQLVAGAEHTCGIVTTGDAYCWGTGFRGELGIGFGTVAQTPSLVAGGNL